jgi:hypothetical protein
VVFVADDLGAWLVGLLADAGRKKLTKLVLGDAQERALQQAAIAAAQDTADELSPSDSQRAEQIAMVINQVFRAPMPDAPSAGPVTLLEGLQAGVARQLAVLDDPSLTGTPQSSADVLGVPGSVLAVKLTGHLVWEITLRGSRGGPLTPLADQLNHDVTHLRGQRIEGMLARLIAWLVGKIREDAAPVLTATAKWTPSRARAYWADAPYLLEATVCNGSNLDYKVRGKCSPARSQPWWEVSFTLPALGTSKIKLGSHHKPSRGPETFEVCDALFLVLETTEGIGSWKRAFQVPRTLLSRQRSVRKPVAMMAIPYPDCDCPGR